MVGLFAEVTRDWGKRAEDFGEDTIMSLWVILNFRFLIVLQMKWKVKIRYIDL